MDRRVRWEVQTDFLTYIKSYEITPRKDGSEYRCLIHVQPWSNRIWAETVRSVTQLNEVTFAEKEYLEAKLHGFK